MGREKVYVMSAGWWGVRMRGGCWMTWLRFMGWLIVGRSGGQKWYKCRQQCW